MKNLNQISIITPTLNASKFINNCILSVKNQKCINVQHIIVDGGSKDNTLEIIKNYNHLDLFELPGSSIYEALNYGVAHVKSPLIGFLNADDEYTKENVLSLINSLLKCEQQIIYGNCRFINSRKRLLYKLKPPSKLNYFFSKIRVFNISHPSWFISKKAFDSLKGYKTNYKYISDCDLIIRALKNKEILFSYINLDIANFLIHTSNASRTIPASLETKRYNDFLFSRLLFYILQINLYLGDSRYFAYRVKRFIKFIFDKKQSKRLLK